MIRRLALLFAAIVLIVGLALGYGLLRRWEACESERSLPEPIDVEIAAGTSGTRALEALARAGVVGDLEMLTWRLKLGRPGGAVQAGEYRFEGRISDVQALSMLLEGRVRLYSVTIPEGLVLEEVAQRFADAGLADVAGFLAAARDPAPIADWDPRAEDLEGYLFPETYRFPKGTPPAELVATMVARFREVVGEDFAERAAAWGLDVREAVTLASMIERETSVPEERGRIARVFHNRLELGMRMQCDPTVRYAWRRKGEVVDRLTYGHLELDSPWNTYVISGLPIGPIANPGRASLEAVLEPDEGRDLYFVAAPGGGHTFSPNLAAHERAVAVWRRYVRSSR